MYGGQWYGEKFSKIEHKVNQSCLVTIEIAKLHQYGLQKMLAKCTIHKSTEHKEPACPV